MQTTKKKPSLISILVGAVLAGYLGYLINGAWAEGIAFNEFMDRFNEVCAVPFRELCPDGMDKYEANIGMTRKPETKDLSR